jgi:hypothetical protein
MILYHIDVNAPKVTIGTRFSIKIQRDNSKDKPVRFFRKGIEVKENVHGKLERIKHRIIMNCRLKEGCEYTIKVKVLGE